MIELIRRHASDGYTKVGYLRPMADGRYWNTNPTIYVEITPGGDQVHQIYFTPAQARRIARELNRAVKVSA